MTSFAGEPASEPLLRLETGMHTAPIKRIATDAAGRWAVTASHDKTARVWEVATGQQLMVLRPPQDDGNEKFYAVALSPAGSTVAVGGWTGYDWDQQISLFLFDRVSGRLTKRVAGLPDVVFHLAYSPDGRFLAASLGGGHGVRLFEAASGNEIARDAEYGSDSCSVHFRPDSRRLATTCYDGSVRLYSVENKRLKLLMSTTIEGGEEPYSARFSPDGRCIADEKMALEREEKHGVFTYTLLQALNGDSDKDRFVNVSELASYIHRRLPEITNRKWGYEQFPVTQTEGNLFPVVRHEE